MSVARGPQRDSSDCSGQLAKWRGIAGRGLIATTALLVTHAPATLASSTAGLLTYLASRFICRSGRRAVVVFSQLRVGDRITEQHRGERHLSDIWLMLAAVTAFAVLLLVSKRARSITKQCVAHPRHECEIDPNTSEVVTKEQ